MSYESAPATKMLLVSCACCGKALVDSVSVETGVGPDCRKKHGYAEAQGAPDWTAVELALKGQPVAHMGLPGGSVEVAETLFHLGGAGTRKVANVLVHHIAEEASGAAHGAAAVAAWCSALAALGYTKLAKRCSERLATCHVEKGEDRLTVRTPYNPLFVTSTRGLPGRRWDKATQTTAFDTAAREKLWRALQASFGGRYLRVGAALTVIPRLAA